MYIHGKPQGHLSERHVLCQIWCYGCFTTKFFPWCNFYSISMIKTKLFYRRLFSGKSTAEMSGRPFPAFFGVCGCLWTGVQHSVSGGWLSEWVWSWYFGFSSGLPWPFLWPWLWSWSQASKVGFSWPTVNTRRSWKQKTPNQQMMPQSWIIFWHGYRCVFLFGLNQYGIAQQLGQDTLRDWSIGFAAHIGVAVFVLWTKQCTGRWVEQLLRIISTLSQLRKKLKTR